MNKASVGRGRRLRDPLWGDPLLCKRSLSSSQGTILMAAKLGKDALWGWRGHDLYSSSVSWPRAEVLSVRKGTLGYGSGSGSNCPGGLARRWMDRAFEGTRAKFNATFREKTAPAPAQFGFWVATLRSLLSAAPSSTPLSLLLGRQGPSHSICWMLLRSELYLHTGGEAWVPSSQSP